MELDPIYITQNTNYWVYVITPPLWKEILDKDSTSVTSLTTPQFYQIARNDIIFIYLGKARKVGFVGYAQTDDAMMVKPYPLYHDNALNTFSVPLQLLTLIKDPVPTKNIEDIINRHDMNIIKFRTTFLRGYLDINALHKWFGKEILERIGVHQVCELWIHPEAEEETESLLKSLSQHLDDTDNESTNQSSNDSSSDIDNNTNNSDDTDDTDDTDGTNKDIFEKFSYFDHEVSDDELPAEAESTLGSEMYGTKTKESSKPFIKGTLESSVTTVTHQKNNSQLLSETDKSSSTQTAKKRRTAVEDSSDSEDEIDQQLKQEKSGKLIDNDDIETESDLGSDDSIDEDRYQGDTDYQLLTDTSPDEGYIPIMIVPNSSFKAPDNEKNLRSALINGLKSGQLTINNNNDFLSVEFWLVATKKIKIRDEEHEQFEEVLASYLHSSRYPAKHATIFCIDDHPIYQECYLVTIPIK